MSGVSIIRSLLVANSAVTDIVPTSSIRKGVVPLGTALPAIAVTQITDVPVNNIRINEARKMYVARIQVTALFQGPTTVSGTTGYDGLDAMMKLIKAACPSQRGTVAGVSVDPIVPEGEGPDMYNEQTKIHARSRDFIVRYIA